jgi:NADH-quinone oxidoreductase subunit E
MMNNGSSQQTKLLAALYLAQEQYGWLSPEAIERVSTRLNIQPGQVLSSASFYTLFKLKPQGTYIIQICEGLSCYLVGGAEPLIEHLSARLGIKPGETSADGHFSLEVVQCLAACGSAPALRVNDDLYENMTLEEIDDLIDQLKTGEF